ncbi:gamma-glutamylcyclotransferase isoform X1 [Cebidichthys violaceus]|uniref:gamma-glutamylcyclotransferase isoform X1 n=3 Tax=Cebidichthys violaceus TaxID=271503 RepID=UPI0035CC9A69
MVCECWKASTWFLSLQLMLSPLSPPLLHTLRSVSSVSDASLPLLIIFLTSTLLVLVSPMPEASDNMENHLTFLYFAYGSNLLKERLQLKNPSAKVHCVASLKDYRLVFGNYKGLASDRWHGGVATIEHSPGDEVWGVVWRMSMSDLESLDGQENVTLGAYTPMELSVKTKEQELICRTYIMNSCVYAPPSPQYLKVIMMGAEQNGLPKDYQEKLRTIKTNTYEGPLPMMTELERARRSAKERANHRSDA